MDDTKHKKSRVKWRKLIACFLKLGEKWKVVYDKKLYKLWKEERNLLISTLNCMSEQTDR